MTTVVGQPIVSLGPQDPSEKRLIYFDFSAWLVGGETISTAVVTAVNVDGADSVGATMPQGSANISGSVVRQLVASGTLNHLYRLSCVITTSLGQTLALSGTMLIDYVFGVAT